MRRKILEAFKNDGKYKVYAPNPKVPENVKDYLVIKGVEGVGSNNNSFGSWKYFEVQCYTKFKDIFKIDDMVEYVTNLLHSIDGVEITRPDTPDYWDDDINAYMKAIEFRMPSRRN